MALGVHYVIYHESLRDSEDNGDDCTDGAAMSIEKYPARFKVHEHPRVYLEEDQYEFGAGVSSTMRNRCPGKKAKLTIEIENPTAG